MVFRGDSGRVLLFFVICPPIFNEISHKNIRHNFQRDQRSKAPTNSQCLADRK